MGKSRVLSPVSTSELKRGPWTPQEDKKLFAFIQQHGHGRWRSLPQKAGLQRCGKSCRLRWKNYLNPHIKRGNFSLQEDQTIIQLHALLGNRWSAIAAILPRRTDNEIKNYWNTHLKKRLAKIGFDPYTHKPMTAVLDSAHGDPKKFSNLSHLAQWENARLQAEARFARQSKLLNPTPPQALPQSQDFNLRAWETILLSSTPSPAAAGGGVGGAGAANAVQEVGSFGKFDGLVWSNKQIETPTLTMPSFPEFNEDVEGELLEPLLLQNSYEINTATGTFGVEDVWTLEQCNKMNNINGYDIDQYVRMSEGLANMYFCGNNLPTN